MVSYQTISLDHPILRVEEPEDGDSRFLQIVGTSSSHIPEYHSLDTTRCLHHTQPSPAHCSLLQFINLISYSQHKLPKFLITQHPKLLSSVFGPHISQNTLLFKHL